jgi:ABC-type Fe3+-hydroxamate transport system substrate-binding protein
VAAIVALRPDLVVVNDEENRREDADALRAAGVPLFVTSVRSVADVAPCLAALATAVGLSKSARPSAQAARFMPLTRDEARRLRAFVPIWRRPWMTMNGDTYGSSVLAALGVDNVCATATDRYPNVTLEEIAALRPDVVLAPSEPFPFGPRHAGELRTVADDVVFVDGQDLFWWGMRTPAAIERLAQAIGA